MFFFQILLIETYKYLVKNYFLEVSVKLTKDCTSFGYIFFLIPLQGYRHKGIEFIFELNVIQYILYTEVQHRLKNYSENNNEKIHG